MSVVAYLECAARYCSNNSDDCNVSACSLKDYGLLVLSELALI